jgi:hypothetical protein
VLCAVRGIWVQYRCAFKAGSRGARATCVGSNDSPIGVFGAIPVSDTTGTIMVKYKPGPTMERGPVVIAAAFQRPDGTTVNGAVTVFVVDPIP